MAKRKHTNALLRTLPNRLSDCCSSLASESIPGDLHRSTAPGRGATSGFVYNDRRTPRTGFDERIPENLCASVPLSLDHCAAVGNGWSWLENCKLRGPSFGGCDRSICGPVIHDPQTSTCTLPTATALHLHCFLAAPLNEGDCTRQRQTQGSAVHASGAACLHYIATPRVRRAQVSAQ